VVVETLVEEFNIFREEGGESVPVHSQDACNGLQRNGREGETAVKERHTLPNNVWGRYEVSPWLHIFNKNTVKRAMLCYIITV